jgi:hypothetical protein
MRMTTGGIVLVLAIATTACGGKKDAGGGEATPKAADPSAEVAAVGARAAPEANGKLPENLKGKIEFTAMLAAKDKVVAVQPKGWTGDALGVRPPEDADLGFMTSMAVSANCDGACEPKKWDEVADKVDFAQFKRADFTVEKDEKLDGGGRLVVARTVDRTYVVAALWKEGAKRYFTCHVTLDQEVAAAAPAFESACRATKVLSWD